MISYVVGYGPSDGFDGTWVRVRVICLVLGIWLGLSLS